MLRVPLLKTTYCKIISHLHHFFLSLPHINQPKHFLNVKHFRQKAFRLILEAHKDYQKVIVQNKSYSSIERYCDTISQLTMSDACRCKELT